jgi:DNA-binding protein HU-beta
MTKNDIINEIATKTGFEKVLISKTVEAFMGTIQHSMITGHNVYLRGFGSFIIKKRAKKTARNISKNTAIMIPAHNIPAFKPAKTFITKVKSRKGKKPKEEKPRPGTIFPGPGLKKDENENENI